MPHFTSAIAFAFVRVRSRSARAQRTVRSLACAVRRKLRAVKNYRAPQPFGSRHAPMAAELRVFLDKEAPAPAGCPDADAFATDLLAILDQAEARGRVQLGERMPDCDIVPALPSQQRGSVALEEHLGATLPPNSL